VIDIQRRFEVFENNTDFRSSMAELYYRQKANVAVVSIGGAGFRVIKRMRPIEIKNVDTYAIIEEDMQESHIYDGRMSDKTGEVKISLYTLNSERNPFLRYASGPIKILNGGTSSKADEQMFMRLSENAVAFVILSGFGGRFSQDMHIHLVGCLRDLGKETLSAVIIPSKLEQKRRQKALSGIRKLEKMGVPYIVFDNENFIDLLDAAAITDRVDAVNLKIADSLDEYISSISSSIDNLKYNLIEDLRR